MLIGRLSVWPSTRSTQGRSAGILARDLLQRLRPPAAAAPWRRRLRSALPGANSTSDWKTKRSPTTRMSGRSPSTCAQPAEEFRAIARQLLDLAGERQVEAAGRDRRSGPADPCSWPPTTSSAVWRSAPAPACSAAIWAVEVGERCVCCLRDARRRACRSPSAPAPCAPPRSRAALRAPCCGRGRR